MKILQVIDALERSGGAEKFVSDLTLALSEKPDVEIEVLSLKKPDNDDYIAALKAKDIEHSSLGTNLYDPLLPIKLQRYIKKHKFDVVHIHLFPALYYGGMSKMLGIGNAKLVYTEHNTTNRRRQNPIFKGLDKIFYKRYDSIIGISSKVKNNLEDHLGEKCVEIINNGIDLKAIEEAEKKDLRKELNLPPDVYIITMVSRITPVKDYKTLIKAAECLPDNFHVLFAGSGPLFEDLLSSVKHSSAADRIHPLGMRIDVFEIIKGSDIIVLSSRHEGFSIAMLEAMSCHKPFVASSVEGIADLVGDVAVTFPYQDYRTLADSLINLKNDHSYYQNVAEDCYKFAKKYDIRNIASNYLETYKTITSS